MRRNKDWAYYHAYHSGAKSKLRLLRYWMDIFDLHPKRDFRLFVASLTAKWSKEQVAVFIHIPKTGGTYVSTSFPKGRFVSFNHSVIRNTLDDTQIPMGLVGTRYQAASNHYLFATVRNPITFFRSYYHHVIGHGDHTNVNHYDYELAVRGFEVLMEAIMNRDSVWPSKKFLFPQLFDESGALVVNWINRNESLDQDLCALADIINQTYQPGSKKRAAPVKELGEYFSSTLLEKVKKAYHRELVLFGYDELAVESSAQLYRDVSKSGIRYDFKNDSISMDEKN